MHDVHTLMRFLLPPGRLTACTVWMFGFQRRLVRRWECDTDLPKPGPFPQTSHTAAMENSSIERVPGGQQPKRVTRQPDQNSGPVIRTPKCSADPTVGDC